MTLENLVAAIPVAATPTPTPISDSLRTQADAALNRIPEGKRGAAEAWVGKQGIEASVGWRLSSRWDVAAWGARQWDGTWDAGARGRVAW